MGSGSTGTLGSANPHSWRDVNSVIFSNASSKGLSYRMVNDGCSTAHILGCDLPETNRDVLAKAGAEGERW